MILMECPHTGVGVAGKSRRKKLPMAGCSDGGCGSFSAYCDRSGTQSFDESSELTIQRNPNSIILKLFYGSDTMLREKEYYIHIHLQRRNIHIYTLVLGQKMKQS